MIKLNASYSRKVPADQEYSSKSFLACILSQWKRCWGNASMQDRLEGLVEQEFNACVLLPQGGLADSFF